MYWSFFSIMFTHPSRSTDDDPLCPIPPRLHMSPDAPATHPPPSDPEPPDPTRTYPSPTEASPTPTDPPPGPDPSPTAPTPTEPPAPPDLTLAFAKTRHTFGTRLDITTSGYPPNGRATITIDSNQIGRAHV